MQFYDDFYDDFYRYARKTRLYVNEWTRREIGRDTWKELLKEFVGQLTIDRTRGSSLNSIWEELVGIIPVSIQYRDSKRSRPAFRVLPGI